MVKNKGPFLHYDSGRARARLRLTQLDVGCCIYICDLDHSCVRSLTASSFQTRYLSAILPEYSSVFQTADDLQWNASRAQP